MGNRYLTPTYPVAVACDTADVNAPASNTAAVVTYNAVAGAMHVISGVAYSYAGGSPTGGNLLIQDGASTVLSLDITAQGAGYIPFAPPGKAGSINTAMTITLAAGGNSVTGKVSVLGHWIQPVS